MSDNTEYYRDRAIAERALAGVAERSNVAAIHSELARKYEALVEQLEHRPRRHIVAVDQLSV